MQSTPLPAENKSIEGIKPSTNNSYYNDMFSEFLRPQGNQQYHYMFHLERGLFAQMQHRFSHFSTSEPLTIIDLCCGEGTNAPIIIEAIKNATQVPSIRYFGSDIQSESIREMAKVINFLKGKKILDDLSTAQEQDVFGQTGGFLRDKKADVLTLRHGLYYMQTGVDGRTIPHATQISHEHIKVNSFLKNVMNQVKDNGYALMFHETETSDLFSKQFNYVRKDGSIIPKMTDAAERIETAARANGYKIVQVQFTPKLYFPVLSNKEINQLKAVRNKTQLDSLNTKQKRWVKLLMFAIQPPKEEFDQFLYSGVFAEYVGKAERIHAYNLRQIVENVQEPPYLLIRQSMQTITCSINTETKLKAICTYLQHTVYNGALEQAVKNDMAAIPKVNKLVDKHIDIVTTAGFFNHSQVVSQKNPPKDEKEYVTLLSDVTLRSKL